MAGTTTFFWSSDLIYRTKGEMVNGKVIYSFVRARDHDLPTDSDIDIDGTAPARPKKCRKVE